MAENTKKSSSQAIPFRQEKRHVHLMVNPELYRLADIERAKAGLGLSEATEMLWKAWSMGKIKIDKDSPR